MYFNSKQPFPKCPNIQPNGTGREAQTQGNPNEKKRRKHAPQHPRRTSHQPRYIYDTLRASNIPLSDMNTAQFDLRSLSFPLSFLRPPVPSLSPPPSSHQHCPHPLLINTASHQPLLVRSVLIWSRPRISIGVVRSCIFRGWDICIGGWNNELRRTWNEKKQDRSGPARV